MPDLSTSAAFPAMQKPPPSSVLQQVLLGMMPCRIPILQLAMSCPSMKTLLVTPQASRRLQALDAVEGSPHGSWINDLLNTPTAVPSRRLLEFQQREHSNADR